MRGTGRHSIVNKMPSYNYAIPSTVHTFCPFLFGCLLSQTDSFRVILDLRCFTVRCLIDVGT